eukprot:10145-Pleurochrysis_carterae.AAC.1
MAGSGPSHSTFGGENSAAPVGLAPHVMVVRVGRAVRNCVAQIREHGLYTPLLPFGNRAFDSFRLQSSIQKRPATSRSRRRRALTFTHRSGQRSSILIGQILFSLSSTVLQLEENGHSVQNGNFLCPPVGIRLILLYLCTACLSAEIPPEPSSQATTVHASCTIPVGVCCIFRPHFRNELNLWVAQVTHDLRFCDDGSRVLLREMAGVSASDAPETVLGVRASHTHRGSGA